MTSSTTFAWPRWADDVAEAGDCDGYDPTGADAARRLGPERCAQLPAIIEGAEAKMAGPDERARKSLTKLLLTIAARVQPGMSDVAAANWATGLILSFSRTPADLVERGVKAAQFKQFGFVNEIGPFVEAEIAEAVTARRQKIARLKRIEEASRTLEGPKEYVSAEQAAAILEEVGLKRSSSKPERPVYDAAAHEQRELDNVNFVRRLRGQDPLTVEDFREAHAMRHRETLRSVGVEEDDGPPASIGL